MAMNLGTLESYRRTSLKSLAPSSVADSVIPVERLNTGIYLIFNQTFEIMRRVLLVHFIRGPTILFAFILASMITLSSIFWPTVGLLVISDKERSLEGYLPVKEKFPDKEDKWLIGYEFLNKSDTKLKQTLEAVARDLRNYLVQDNECDSCAHWCGSIEDCVGMVYQGVDPTRSSVLYPTNNYYLFLVRRVWKNETEEIFGYHSVAPFGTFHLPEVAIKLYLPMKAKVDEFFMKENVNSKEKGQELKRTRLKMGFAALGREPLLESFEKQAKEKTGKVFLITVMAIHQYLASACLIVCVGSIMVSDKETGFRSLMSLMGMRRVSYITAHFIVAQGFVVIIALIGTIIHVTVADQLTEEKLGAADYLNIFLSNVVNSWHQCGLALAMCSFSRSTRAVMFPLLALFASFVVIELLMVKQMMEKLQNRELSPLDDYGYIFPSLAHSSIHAQILTKKTFTMKDERVGFYFGMQILIALCCIIIGVYLDCVIESGTGHRFSYDFPIVFLKIIYKKFCGQKVPEKRSAMLKRNHAFTLHRMVEEASEEFTRVWMKQVTKVYTRWRGIKRSYFCAVSKVDLSLQKGEITAILGHNGAGKTTIFNILTGLSPATSGYIRIFGQDPLNAWDAIRLRRITGVCTQFDVLDGKLTAFEHMRLMGAIKGLGGTGIEVYTAKLFSQLELDAYIDTATHIMPGGDKRKLSVAMALIGEPRLILLDEPTSGVDPLSRRCIWRVLRDFRPNRVIVLITHYMDEADVLADRKAIMIGGKLICYGTSKFLKDNYFPGYLLHVTCMKMSHMELRLQKYLTHLEGVTFLRAFNEQMTFFVKEAAIDSVSRRLFSQSGQEELQKCRVTSLGFAVTTLEEIFLKLDEEPYEDEADKVPEEPSQFITTSWPLKGLVSIQSMLEGYSDMTASVWRDTSLLPKHPRSEFRIGFRQFVLFLRVLLGLLVLPTPIHILLRTLLPVFGVAASAIIYYLERSNRVHFDHYDFVNRVNITSNRQHISIAKPESKDIDDSVFKRDLQCIRTQLGPLEPYTTVIKFDRSTKYSVELGERSKEGYVFKRYGSTRIDINKWNEHEIDVTVILGTHDFDLTHQIMLQHFLFSNCIHKKNLIERRKMEKDNVSVLWVGDLDSWESMWPEVHPQLKLGTACISMMSCGIFNCILNPLIAGDIVRDKELMVLSQLELYGMRYWAYWGAHYCVHIFQYLLLACFTTIIMFPFPKHILRSWQTIILHNWISFLSAVDNICMIYVCCLFFKRVSGAVVLFGSTILIAVFVYITVFFIPLSMLEAAYGAILFIFPFTDPYLALMLTDFRIRVEKVFLFGDTDHDYVPSLWRQLWYNHSRISQIIHLTRILILGSFFIGANFYLFQVKRQKEDYKYRKMIKQISSTDEIDFEQLPSGVRGSARNVVAFVRLKSSTAEADENTVAFVYNLSKTYFLGSLSIFTRFFQSCSTNKEFRYRNAHVAIANTSFLVNRGEIFGVLGPSGAGKSTLLDCLATKLQADFGQVGIVSSVTGELISNHAAANYGAIGYCPQHNPIWPQLTVREHLVVYSVMRDVREEMIDYHVTKLIQQVNLQRYTHTYAGALSGGCKRRLSMAISMVGDPTLIIMDEPSCGVDPRSRRNLWRTLLNCARSADRGCVISTHFIDEGESLCDHLAILVDGNTLAIGTPYRLKRSCGAGFYVEIKVSRDYSLMPDEADFVAQCSVEKFVRETKELFPLGRVVDRFEERVSFRFPSDNFEHFRDVFVYLLAAHRGGTVEDFTVCSPTLEQVYFDLAKSQVHSSEE